MRKRLITPTPENIRTRGEGWLDVERAAVVEVTSEDKDSPVEAAFVSGDARELRGARGVTAARVSGGARGARRRSHSADPRDAVSAFVSPGRGRVRSRGGVPA